MSSKIDIAQNFDLSYDMVDIMCGDFVGEGCSRIVYDCPLCPGFVVKIEVSKNTHHNMLEYYMWTSVVDQPEVSKWLAPVGWMSANGRIMLQKKVTHINDNNRKLIPEKVPAFMTDMKDSNYGFIGKQFVCFDYAFSLEMCGSHAMNNKMRKFKPFM